MARELKMPDDQKAKLLVQVQANERALKEWEVANAARIRQIKASLIAANRAGKADEATNLSEQLAALEAARMVIERANMEAALDLLTDDQRAAWEGLKAYRQMRDRFRMLDESQQGMVRQMCDAVGKSLAEAQDATAGDQIIESLAKEIATSVLTDAQREELAQKPASRNSPTRARAGRALESSQSSGGSEPGLTGQYAVMASELKMDDTQKAKLLALLHASDAAIRDWIAENADKIKHIEAKIAAAARSGEHDELTKLNVEMDALNDAREAIAKASTDGVIALLTDEQRAAWEGYKAYCQMSIRFNRARLDATQNDTIRKTCAAAGRSLVEAKTAEARDRMLDAIAKDIAATVLTDAQRETMATRRLPRTSSHASAEGAKPIHGEPKPRVTP